MELSREQFLRRAAAGGGILVTGGGVLGFGGEAAAQEGDGGSDGGDDPFASQVDAGLEYFMGRADDQLPLVEELMDAIGSGDYERATSAYVNARPPYEEIEVLAANFEDADSDIDARPYSFDDGDESEDFRGFHRIEGLLYRDCDLDSALPYAEGLVRSVEALREDLRKRENFSSTAHFEGMIALATEVPSKKISSEEETYSDQSLLIFSQNWRGIYSQFWPFAEEVERRRSGAVAAVTEAYGAAQGILEPYFTDGSWAGAPYSSIGVAERGNIVRASYRFRDTLLEAREILELV